MVRTLEEWIGAVSSRALLPASVLTLLLPAGCGEDEQPAPREQAEQAPAEKAETADTKTASEAGEQREAPPVHGYAALSDAEQKQAQELYARHCAACHGEQGAGKGLAAQWLFPKPRDFTAGNFRLVSTTNQVPTTEDLQTILVRGMPGSAMPPWPQLDETERRLLIAQVMEFRREGIRRRERAMAAEFGEDVDREYLQEIVQEQTTPGPILEVPPLGEATSETIQQGRQLYEDKGCVSCHGEKGRGEGQEKMVDAKELPTRPRDLTRGIFKGEPDPKGVFRRIQAGMPGTPMPATRNATPEQVAAMTHYVLSLSDEATRQQTVLNREQVAAVPVNQVPETPDAPAWDDVPAVRLRTTPLWWRDDYPRYLRVQAVHDGEAVAFRLSWDDAGEDRRSTQTHAFRDAVALELFRGEREPFLGMGATDSPVDVWMWDADRQSGSDVEDVYPNTVVDRYPISESTVTNPEYDRPGTQTAAQAAATIPAQAAGNRIVPDKDRESATALEAGGPGSATFRPSVNDAVTAQGQWSNGRWHVVMRRPLQQEDAETVSLVPGEAASVAFAIWNGSRRDRNGQKVITIWQDLVLETEKPQ